ncbi:MAG: AAA family ATPase [Planktothrix sp.]
MIILCTHNDGGVGKTTLAVHIAGVLLNRGDSVLLVDCDDQADLWQFFTKGQIPTKLQDSYEIENSKVIWNKDKKSIKKEANPIYFDHVVLDIDSPLQNTVQVILGNEPDLILVPINISQNIKALRNLPRTLKVISQLESKTGLNPQAIIVPLGIPAKSVEEVVSKILSNDKPKNCRIAPEMENLQNEIQEAIYQNYEYIWEKESHDELFDYFLAMIEF